jgi:hypothetical protein
MPTRMAIGMSARVAYDDRDRPLRLRRESNTDSDIVAELEQGTEFTVLDEHQCSDVYTWWHIETNDGLRGWVAEADPTQNPQLYFIEPTSLAPRTVLIITDSSCPGAPPTNFQIGDIAQVDFNADGALLLTVSPRGDRPSRDNVGQLHDNEQMEIQNGPVCAGDRWRWYVRDLAAGMRGWASEGVSGDAWICSLSNPECGS